MAGAQAAQQLVAVHARHVDVADHQAEGFARHRLQCFFAGTDGLEVVAGQQQRVGQRFTQGAVILDQ